MGAVFAEGQEVVDSDKASPVRCSDPFSGSMRTSAFMVCTRQSSGTAAGLHALYEKHKG